MRSKPVFERPAAIDRSQPTRRLVVAGSIVGALAASSCCIVPLVLFSLGVSGAWIGSLTRLAPYQPYILAATAACLGYGFWLTYRARREPCEGDAGCARPLSGWLSMAGLLLATALTVGAIAFNLFSPLLLQP